ncbi:SecY-interacting protein [Alteromonas aestuariivivens]|uniref:Protein Syd n=1 Tax=Alteromonas aestuariivivens TaxID=1938339 RepID=A0A3D8M4B0_9ALTE|nr:SecY-interacting protein [Alteromonas aestuariivivens]RDV24385.1 SecY-interacting protein [Alteromonas aestuariivivens]
MSNLIETQLSHFIEQYLCQAEQLENVLYTAYDPDWPSPCYQSDGEAGELVAWRPVKQTEACSFGDLEQALEMTLNEQFCCYFTLYFSENLPARAEQGKCELLQVWNAADFERLQENLVGHVLMKRRLQQPPTLFFALTDRDDFILSVDNATGEVVLEQVGKRPVDVLAPDLATFLSGLVPCVD